MEQLYLSDPLQRPLLRRVVETIGLPPGSHGLDAGCGVGLQLPLFAEAVGPRGRLTGLDIHPEFLEEARRNVDRWGLAGRVSLVQGDVYRLPFREGEFDWIWSASCACYAMVHPMELLNGLRRILKPGGSLLIVVWTAEQLLPGYPRLEALLHATTPGLAPFKAGTSPENHFLRLAGWMRRAGFREVTARPFTEGVCAPFAEPIRMALVSLLEMRWSGAEEELTSTDRRLYRSLTDPSSPDFILNIPDYYGFYTYTLFRGKSPV
jgi:demethylmenaquinone methyltransferase/2-methoxy-6-polyprenyl-1,4-benzoquinol methylase